MYRAHGTRIMTVHANHPALRSPRIPSMLAHPQKYKDVPWTRPWSCRFVFLVVTYTPTFALHLTTSCCQSAPRGVAFLFTRLDNSKHVGQALQQEGHWQCHRANTTDTARLADRRIPSRRETNMVACSCHSTAGSQHDPYCSTTGTSVEETGRWFWAG